MHSNTQNPALPATLSPIADALGIGNTVLQLESITQARLAAIGTAEIAELSQLLDSVASRIKTAQGEILKTYTSRYAERARLQLLASGRDTGTTHVIDGELDIAVEIDKTVKWCQAKLPVIWDRIAATGDDPRQYIEVKYSINETKYKAWPETLKQPFTPARTVTPGKPKFTVSRIGEGK